LKEYEEALRARIDTYITTAHTVYDRGTTRWTQLQPPTGIQVDTDNTWVYRAFVSVIEKIANDFNLLDLGDRELKNTSRVSIPHQNVGEPAYDKLPTTRPDLCIIGVGDSLSPLKDMATVTRSPTYRNVRNMADIKPDQSLKHENADFMDTGVQLGRYARQIMHEQVNRHYVDSIAVSPHYLRVFSFDRVGGSFFKAVDVHKDPVLFVEAVVMLFLDESAIGLDTSFTYTPEKMGRKTSTTVEGRMALDADYVRGSPNRIQSKWFYVRPNSDAEPEPEVAAASASGNDERRDGKSRDDGHGAGATNATDATTRLQAKPRYTTVPVDPGVSLTITGIGTNRHCIIGRGTTCWYAKAKFEGKDRMCIVKDYWRAVDRESEADFLKEAIGISGVGQIFAYQEFYDTEEAGSCGYNTISGIRGYDPAATSPLSKLQRTVLDPNVKLSNRIRCRVLIERYHDDISLAPDPKTLLIAFRDAVAGNILFIVYLSGSDCCSRPSNDALEE